MDPIQPPPPSYPRAVITPEPQQQGGDFLAKHHSIIIRLVVGSLCLHMLAATAMFFYCIIADVKPEKIAMMAGLATGSLNTVAALLVSTKTSGSTTK